jgi:hypothetical protein
MLEAEQLERTKRWVQRMRLVAVLLTFRGTGGFAKNGQDWLKFCHHHTGH